MAADELRVPIGIPVETNADEAADSIEGLRRRIEENETALREMTGGLRRLRGSSDEVKTAKEQLKAKIDATRNSVSAANLALLKQGTTYDKLAKQTKEAAKKQDELKKKLKDEAEKKAAERADALRNALSRAGGPVAGLRDKLNTLKEVTGGAGGALGLLTLGIAGLVAAVAALGVALIAAGAKLATFIIQAANAARTANLFREAATGSAQNAYALGTQVDELARKLPTAKSALNELAISIAKGRVQGEALVDTFNAVGQASAALGDDAGAKLKSLVERGAMIGNFSIGSDQFSDDLLGTGLSRDDVAAVLAKNLKVSIGKARQALAEGRVKLADGAKALREAVEKKFEGINARRMLDLEVISAKLRESWSNLTRDVNLEPLLRGLQKIATVFDESTVTGDALKKMVTAFGNSIATSVEKGAPLVKSFLQGLIIGGLQGYIVYLQLANAFKKAFGDTNTLRNVDLLAASLSAGAFAAKATAMAIIAVVGTVALAAAAISGMKNAITDAYDFVAKTDWKALGLSVVDGLLEGLSFTRLETRVREMGTRVKNAFKDSLDIHSPSKVFERYGENIDQGAARGISKNGNAQAAAEEMVTAPGGARGGRGIGGTTIQVNATIVLQGSSGAAEQMKDPALLAAFTKLIEDAAAAAGFTPDAVS